MGKRMSDNEVDVCKIASYLHLVRALSSEKLAIKEFGTFSQEAYDADMYTAKARRNYELWRKK
jgi:hypothetical protein